MRTLFCAALICSTVSLAGCPGPRAAAPGDPAIRTSKSAAPGTPVGGINLVVGDEKKLAQMLAAHQGEVVFVDFWATWCPPCVEAFPHTVEVSRKYQDRGLQTIAVNFDYLEDEPAVREFLAKQGATFANLMSNYDDISPEVGTAFDFEALPELRLYDRAGKLRHEWLGPAEDLEQRIEELLAETSSSEAATEKHAEPASE